MQADAPQQEHDEEMIFNGFPWTVTNKRIRTRDATYRISDIASFAIQRKSAFRPFDSRPFDRHSWTLLTLLFLALFLIHQGPFKSAWTFWGLFVAFLAVVTCFRPTERLVLSMKSGATLKTPWTRYDNRIPDGFSRALSDSLARIA